MTNLYTIAKFLWANYPEFNNRFNYQGVVQIMNMLPHRVKTYEVRGELQAVALFFKLSDRNFNLLQKRVIDTSSITGVKRCIYDDGPNIHFFLLCSLGGNTFGIYKCLREIIRDEFAYTVSWYSLDRSKLNVYYPRSTQRLEAALL